MKNKLAPSMMCCNFLGLGEQLAELQAGGVDLLHIDVMDGHFVPNLAMGTDLVRQLGDATDIPMDLHFMVEEPERFFDAFPIRHGDYVSVHFEATRHLQRALYRIRERGAKALLALNPGTPVEAATDLLDDLDGLLIMAVNPGFAGQKMIPHTLEKLKRAREFFDANGKADAELEVDGNVSVANAILMKQAGANIFVAGTSAVFCGTSIAQNVQDFRKAVFA